MPMSRDDGGSRESRDEGRHLEVNPDSAKERFYSQKVRKNTKGECDQRGYHHSDPDWYVSDLQDSEGGKPAEHDHGSLRHV